jgi:lipopolysaccharide/colanic/teichoic acid biosynthesis glycosyltransferase
VSAPPAGTPGWRSPRLYSEAEFWENRLHRIDIDRPGTTPAPACRTLDAACTRGGDILLSLALLLFSLPPMLLAALLIKLDSPGPVLYRQQRVGLNGQPFMLLKLRSMRMDAEADGPVWAIARDPRVTRIGAVIRLTRIDELPQLVNVLRGEMSFIGPRPERPHFVDQLAGTVPLYCERARVKPGLTGWAQVNYPYGASVEDARAKLSYDLYYTRHRSPALAVLILLSTVWVVLFQKGAR